jgi:hypothetical protein
MRYLAVEGPLSRRSRRRSSRYFHRRLTDRPRYLALEQVNRLIAACGGTLLRDGVSAQSSGFWCVSDCGPTRWRNYLSPISSERQARCVLRASCGT